MQDHHRETRVVITGLGIICPIGSNKQEVLKNIESCKGAIQIIKKFDASSYDCQYGAEVQDYEPSRYFSAISLAYNNLCTQYAILAIRQALEDSKLDISSIKDRTEIGLCVGSSHGALDVIHQYYQILYGKLPEVTLNREFLFRKLHSSTLKIVARELQLNGAFSMISTACASGNNAVGMGADWIRLGKAKYVIAGGSDVLVMPLHAGFWGLKATSPQPCSPFSGTPGISLGEGAAFFIMEDLSTALERNAPVYAEFLGYGLSGDAYHATSPDPQGKGVILAMERALADARISREDVEYVNAHGTGTNGNDQMESAVFSKFFKERAPQVPLSSLKSYFGHATGAASAIELCSSILCMNHGILPPTLNFTQPRYNNNLDYIPNQVRYKKIKIFLKNSYGFAGNNAVVAMAAYDPLRPPHPPVPQGTRVVISGLGMVSAIGLGISEFWKALKEKRNGIIPITRFDTTPYTSPYACLIEGFRPQQYDRKIDDRRMDLLSQFSCVAAQLCLTDTGLKLKRRDCEDIGIIMCVSSAPREGIAKHLQRLVQEGADHPSSIYFPYSTQNSALGQVSIYLGVQGFTSNLHVDGCSGLNGMIYGYTALKLKRSEKILVGGGDEVHWTYFKELSILGELAGTAIPIVPFSEHGKGYHPGEGGIFLLMETLDSAKARNAPIYAEMVGYGMCIDSNDDVPSNDPSGKNLISAMEIALRDGGIAKEQIGMICSTDRGIPLIWQSEQNALKTFFGSHWDKLAFINTIPYTGWLDSVSPLFNIAAMSYAFRHNEVIPSLDGIGQNSKTGNLQQNKSGADHKYCLCLGIAREGFNYAILLNSSDVN